jgi:hypothetical protein
MGRVVQKRCLRFSQALASVLAAELQTPLGCGTVL